MKKTQYRIEYIVHIHVSANSEDEALDMGAYSLHMLESAGNLSDRCEFLSIKLEDDDE